MLMADNNSDFWSTVDFSTYEDSDNFSIDIDSLYAILSEDSDPSQNHSLSSSGDLLCKKFQEEATAVEVNHVRSSQTENGIHESKEAPPMGVGLSGSSPWYSSECSEFSDSRTGMGLEGWFGFPENSGMILDHGKPPHIASPVTSCSASLAHWLTMSYAEHDTCSSERVGGSINAPLYFNTDSKTMASDIQNCSTAFNFAAGDANHATGYRGHVSLINVKSENENENEEFWSVGGDLYPKCASHFTTMENSCLPFGNYNDVIGNSIEGLGALDRGPCMSTAEVPCIDPDPSTPCLPVTSDLPLMDGKGEKMIYIKAEVKDQLFASQNICTNGKMNLGTAEAITGVSDFEASTMDSIDINNCLGKSFKCEPNAYCSPTRTNSSTDADDEPLVDDPSRPLLPGIQSFALNNKEMACIQDAREDKLHASKSASHSVNDIVEAVSGSHSPVSGTDGDRFAHHASSQSLHATQSLTSSKHFAVCVKDERKDQLLLGQSESVKVTGEIVQGNPLVYRSHVDDDDDDDADICILEDISDPRHPPPVVAHGKTIVASQRSAYSDPAYQTGAGSTRIRKNEESLTFRVALQDLSQPKSEASPQDGVLAVPLLRHQRIALSWMVQKETASLHCSGGILADDQGLGKTISTIALILKERAPLSKVTSVTVKRDELKTLNLDGDDFGDSEVLQLDGKKEDGDSGTVVMNKTLAKSENASILAKGRPAAGTLVVCPTSVLRQWAEELHNKVTREANLTTLVYHGSNRTKDPFELAKYDVVITTYSIVSMEVPKQALVDKDDNEKVKLEGHDLPPMELSSSRKRKYPPNSDKKSRKNKKGMDGAMLESSARPLARVGWFRVVLDEAQSIKNHRTQVARACWGLRAKRRWCLSGTPIQNAVDDLYSYFRFLRYDPYAVYKSFCSMIKVPINRNPTNGYRKLQAVLKTIMLRRTKATLIDGEPIITLPPKTVELKKVDFSKEERDFYSKLEADSRAQFNVYAASGTVQQNYVNILLMLLRLRQACDHPLLVKDYDSNSVWRSSVEMANKLPREKQLELLNLLEDCLEICSICNDPPEDAAVTICGHVFCNQCICEHLTGDDNLCPASQCKVQLSVASVFSRATLKCSLSDQPGHDSSTDKSASRLVEKLEPYSKGLSNSSKIKAALEVLQSLSKPLDSTSNNISLKSVDEVARFPGNTSDCHLVGACKDFPDKRHVDSEKDLGDSSSKLSEKAIVFSQWTRMLDLLEAHLKNSSIQYRRLDGTMSVVARDKAVKDFNTLPEVSVMIMSLKAASLGLNMVVACRVLLLDLWWNPTTEDQAIDRAHRIGQTRPVTVLRLTVKDTVEDRILALQQKKREMVASAFGEDETGSRQTRLTVDDLKYLFMV